jgi:hypothetical protein
MGDLLEKPIFGFVFMHAAAEDQPPVCLKAGYTPAS